MIMSSNLQTPTTAIHPRYLALLEPIHRFLKCETPKRWLEEAAKPENLPVLLIDHCKCELKAAQTGMLMMRRYALSEEGKRQIEAWVKPYENFVYFRQDFNNHTSKQGTFNIELELKNDDELNADIVKKMVALVKEELQHFEQVLDIIQSREIIYEEISASRYARGLLQEVRTHEPAAMIDKLIVGAYIEARSCERFASLAPLLDEDLKTFYLRLLKSEARHYEDYLALARKVAATSKKEQKLIDERIEKFGQLEAELILSEDDDFRFHSGVPR